MSSTFHPLDPLTAPEFAKVAEILAAAHGVGDGWRYTSIEMVEPAKADVAAFDATGAAPDRRALATLLDTANNSTYKSVVSLTDESVLSWDHIPGVQPNFTVDEWEEADRCCASTGSHCGPGETWHHRHGTGVHGHLDLRRRGDARQAPSPLLRSVTYC